MNLPPLCCSFNRRQLTRVKNFNGLMDGPDGIAQIAVLFDPGFCQDRGWLCGDESFLRERVDILHDRIFCTANSFSNRGVAGPALVGTGVFKTTEVGVDRDLTCAQPQRKNFVRQCKLVFTGKLIHGVSSCSSGWKS